MFTVAIIRKGEGTVLVLETESRSNARAVALVAKENDYLIETTVEVPAKERIVKFKGVD